MSAVAIECPLCGSSFERAVAVCDACPLNGRCATSCCPTCGYGILDPQASRAVALATRLVRRVRARRARDAGTLAGAAPGEHLRVAAVDALAAPRREQLAAFGLEPGRRVEVVQARPVTIVRVDLLELALERSVARGVRVEAGGGVA